MKSSVFCISAIAASSLITISSATLASAQPKSISASQSQSVLISEHSTQMQKAGSGAETNGRLCIPILDPLCGWW
ncbi:hypothetical protein [Pseudanabaena sp. SR411]|uniref:hypothetical protein n=1 Tax=Pseudanabaena sp. SR411 TaxID=1980935 RepID=UPI0011401E0A|nr:hypothetical protein [Pseudanabaena sp. SR411]